MIVSKNLTILPATLTKMTNVWEQERLGNLSDIKSGDFVIKIKQSPIFKFPVYNGGSTYTGFYKEFNFLGPKVVISSRGAAGSVNYVKSNFWAGNSVFVLDFMKDKMVNLFFSYILLKNLEFKMRSMISSTGIPALSVKDVCKIKLFLCNLNEQQRIGNIFSLINSLITLHQRELKILKNFKKSLFQKMIVGKNLTILLATLTKMTNVWEQEKIGNICEFKNGKAHENLVVTNGKYTLINSKFISSDGEISKTTNIQLTPLQKDEITIVLSDIPKGKALAKTFIIDKNNKYTLNQRIGSLKVISLNNVYFINLIINRNKYFLNFDDKINQTNLTNLIILECKVNLTKNISEQNKIAVIFNNINSLITLHQRKLKILKNFKKSLFQKMIVGKNLTILPVTLTKMTNVWEQERLGKYFKIYRNVIYINDNQFYKQITIRNTGNIEKRNITQGIKIGRKRQFLIDLKTYPNTLTFIRQGVKDGGIGFVPDELNNAIVTENMPLFSISGCDINFLISLFRTFSYFKAAILNNPSTGSAQQAIHEKDWLISIIAFPNINEQKRIGIIFSLINSLITLHQRELKILKIFKKSLFVKMIVGKNLTILPATLTKMTNVWEQERLGNVTLLNKYKQYSASFLEKIRKDFGPIKLLPSSINYDWFTDFVNAENKYNNSEVITLGRARNANTKYWKGLFISSNNHIIESYDKNIIENYFLYWIIKVNEKKFYSEETTYPHFVIQDFNGLVFFFPIRIEQLKIISLINNISSLITLHQRELKILKIIKKSLFVKMIVGKNLTILPATLTKMTNVWEQERLGNVTLLNKYKQYSASFLEKIRKDFGPIKLLPSSINYDWFTDFVNAENKYNNSEVITLGRARNANTKYWKGLFISSNNHIIESYDKNIIENYFLYWIIKVNEKKFYSEETTYPHFVIQDFNGLVFFFPIRIEQLKIISLINNISSLITLHQRGQFRRENEKKIRNFVL
ncbi:restriction endonuclease subunit S [Mycoplasmopsis cynos]|uniref:restriction endonuclease subunit S n=1 Tax=Mycoplasmopsis cynos TaxID=171284 RepID=UPI0030CECA02